MWISAASLPVKGADDNHTSGASFTAATTTTTTITTTSTTTTAAAAAAAVQSPALSSDLPLSAIISGLMISVVIIVVLIYTAICSRRSSRRHLFSHREQRQTLVRTLDTALQDDDHANAWDYSTVNNAFIGTSDASAKDPHYTRDDTLFKSDASLGDRPGDAADDGGWISRENAAWNRAYDQESDQGDSQSEDDVVSEASSYRTWLLGSVDRLDVIPEENEDVVTVISVPLNSPKRLHSRAESEGRDDSDPDSESVFLSCSEGDDLSTAVDTEGTQDTTLCAPGHSLHTVSHDRDLDEGDQFEHTSLLLREEISRVSSDICRMTFDACAIVDWEGASVVEVSMSSGDGLSGTGSIRSKKVPPKPPRKFLPRKTIS